MGEVKFEALQKTYLVPDTYKYVSLGPSIDFLNDISNFLKTNYTSEFKEYFLRIYANDNRMKIKNGFNYNMLLDNEEGIEEKHAIVIWRPDVKEWYNRGHEEGHAASFLGLKNEIINLVGYNGPLQKEELLCDLCGLYSLEIRNLSHLMDEHKKRNTEILRL